METVPSAQMDASVLEHFYVPAAGGRQVPLPEVATFELTTGPLSVAHSGQMASMTISFNLAAGRVARRRDGGGAADRAGDAAGVDHRRVLGHGAGVPGIAEGNGDPAPITIFIIYIILGILYESFIHPVTILTGLPFAAFGALFALYITHIELGVYGYVGIIMLIGIVEKNAIMMIDFALERQRSERIRRRRRSSKRRACASVRS